MAQEGVEASDGGGGGSNGGVPIFIHSHSSDFN